MGNVEENIIRLCTAMGRYRIPASSEAEAQRGVEMALTAAGIPFEPQRVIAAGERLDLMCDGVAIEIKVRGSRTAIMRQLERYASHPDVTGTILVTATAWPLLSGEIGDKPFRAVLLGEGWF